MNFLTRVLKATRRVQKMGWFGLMLVLAISFAVTSIARAQSGGGSITGTVTDSTGAVIPGATITAKNLATGRVVVRQSTSAGLYNVQPLEVGDYSVTVEATGFGKQSTDKVHVDALQTVAVNFSLTPGTAVETVSVTTGGLNEVTPTVGDSVNSQDYQLLPLVMNGGPRDPTAFVNLANGVNSSRGYNGGAVGYNNETYLDGVVATTINAQGAANNTSSGAIVEAVEQSEVQTVGISAKYQGQGFNNFTLKSGANKFHGSGFEYFRNTALDTWNYLSKQTKNALGQTVKPNEKQNEYGFVLGGPIKTDKAFFFVALERMNYRSSPNPSYFSLPTMAMRGGDFSAYAAETGYHIYDPTTTTCDAAGKVCTRKQFTGDIIPASRISEVSKKIQSYLPTNLVNQSIQRNYLGSLPFGYNYFKASAKGDYQINSNHRLSATYLVGQRAPVGLDSGNVLPLPYSATTRTVTFNTTAMMGLNSVLSPHLVNDLKYSFLRYETVGADPASGGKYTSPSVGLNPTPKGWATDGFPVVVFTGNYAPQGFKSSGSTNNTNRPSVTEANTFGITEDLQWTLGRHNLSIGGAILWYQYNSQLPLGGSSDSYSFDTTTTSQFNNQSATVSTTQGATYAGYLLGGLSGLYLSSNNSYTSIGGRFKAFSPYVQDDWKVNQKLTLNLGLRWDVFTPFREVGNRMSFFNPDLPNPVATGYKGSVQYAGYINQYACQCTNRYSTYLGNIEPRLGFAYKLTPSLVMHGSYGIMTTHSGGTGGRGGAREGTNQFGLASSISVAQISKYEVVQQWDNTLPTPPTPTIDNTYGIGNTTTAGFTGSPQAVFYDEPVLARRSGYYHNFALGFEQQLFAHTIVSVDYSGSTGHFLPNANGHDIYSNQVRPQYLALGSLLSAKATAANIATANQVLSAAGIGAIGLPYPNYSPSATIGQMLRPWPMYDLRNNFPQDGNSAYNALMISLKQQGWKGLSLTINYTYSRLIDDLAARTSTYIKANKWNVDSGPQALKIYGSWMTPKFGAGRWEQRLTGGWLVSSIYTYASSNPMTYSTSCNADLGYFGACRVSLNPSYKGGSFRSNAAYGSANFTKSAFTGTPFSTSTTAFGNAPYANAYGVTGPSTYAWDGSVRRTFPVVGEKLRLTMGADFFNITNHVEATGLTTNITSSAFGLASKQSNASRDIQLNAKFDF